MLEPCERILTWVKDVTTVVAADIGKDLVALAGNAVPIRRTEELVAAVSRDM